MARAFAILPVGEPKAGDTLKGIPHCRLHDFALAIVFVPVADSLRAPVWRSLASDRDTSE